ncbi:hypothetical protein G5B38_00525 [Pseudohalocynthiibacter aestuariivivens]|nr:hypothetical protein [Pseudohalocynthiibacter aestuariivivens]QIE44131.1 hypothetical protein G5B38_00525 [Pseudohalocynthiibacter aestuariivivens]
MSGVQHIPKSGLALAALVALSGCVTPGVDGNGAASGNAGMRGYVGRSVTEAMIDHGRPVQVVEAENGTRAFHWLPKATTANNGTANAEEVAAWMRPNTTEAQARYPATCLYTLIGQRQGEGWVVTGLNAPTAKCEGI